MSQRHDALLGELARTSGGAYYVGMSAAMGRAGVPALAKQLVSKDRVTYLPGTPDKQFEARLMSWLLLLICSALCLEWLIRRLSKLA